MSTFLKRAGVDVQNLILDYVDDLNSFQAFEDRYFLVVSEFKNKIDLRIPLIGVFGHTTPQALVFAFRDDIEYPVWIYHGICNCGTRIFMVH